MKNRISFCVNACKKSTFRFIGGLQNVLRFLFTSRNDFLGWIWIKLKASVIFVEIEIVVKKKKASDLQRLF